MAFIVKKEILITRHEGDTTDITFTVPDLIDLANYTEVIFQVNSNAVGGGPAVFTKKQSDGGITVLGQVITITIVHTDTKGFAGTHRWELEISNGTALITTIGYGAFVITRHLIKHD